MYFLSGTSSSSSTAVAVKGAKGKAAEQKAKEEEKKKAKAEEARRQRAESKAEAKKKKAEEEKKKKEEEKQRKKKEAEEEKKRKAAEEEKARKEEEKRKKEAEKKAKAEETKRKRAASKAEAKKKAEHDAINKRVVHVKKGADEGMGIALAQMALCGVDAGSPAERAGGSAHFGRKLTHVNGEPVAVLEDVMKQVVGKEEVSLHFGPKALGVARITKAPNEGMGLQLKDMCDVGKPAYRCNAQRFVGCRLTHINGKQVRNLLDAGPLVAGATEVNVMFMALDEHGNPAMGNLPPSSDDEPPPPPPP
eukprot:gene26848-41169_t